MLSSRKSSAPVSGAFSLTKSLRLRRSATAYLNRTPSTSSNTQKFTWSGWVKKAQSGVQGYLFDTQGGSQVDGFYFDSNNTIQFRGYNSSVTYQLITSAVFVDPSAWYHIVVSFDSTQATASNRAFIYVNGVQASLSTASYPSQNYNSTINTTAYHAIGEYANASSTFLDGNIAEIYFVDGQQLTPTSFGAFSATTGVWQPIKYTGTYGTNGFHLPFTNTTSTTTLGYDTSGNSNNWTTNNISLTAGSTYDSMNDVPVAYSATAANYPVLNPNASVGGPSVTNGNLTFQATGNSYQTGYSSVYMPTSGKWYYEFTLVTYANNTSYNQQFSIGDGYSTGSVGFSDYFVLYATYLNTNYWYGYSGVTDTGIAAATGDVVQFAYDASSGKLWVGKNNTWFVSGNPSAGTSPIYTFSSLVSKGVAIIHYGTTPVSAVNFGQQPFAYTPPTGFQAINTYNLPTPAIAQGNKYMDATLYTGTGATASITNAAAFKPDLVWIKSRSAAATDHKLTDSVRGVTKALISDTTGAETTDTNGLTAFNSNGFTIGTDTNYNNSGATYVGWQWQAGAGSSSSNTNGTITSTVSVSTTAGFSVVTYTGTGSSATVGHGLGSTPSMVVVKQRTSASATSWYVYHISLSSASYAVYFNSTLAQDGPTGVFWNNTAPTSSVFSIGTSTGVNVSSGTYVAYCFAPIAGFSAFGSYTGNGSSTLGPFVYCGFQPKFVICKRYDTGSTESWFMMDTTRSPYNTNALYLLANTSGAEGSGTSLINIYSNGFQPAGSTAVNANTGTYIYMAFASNPFAYSNAF